MLLCRSSAVKLSRMRVAALTASKPSPHSFISLPPSTRSFFFFASPSRSLVKSHRDTQIVPFSAEEMFDVVADVDKYHEFLPFCVDSRVLRQPNENVMEAALCVGFKVFTESYTSRVIMKRPEKIVVKAIESPTFKRIESEWVFRPVENAPNSCEVDFKVTFEVASFLHANAIQLFFDDVAVTQLNAFIGRTRKLHGNRPAQVVPPPSPPHDKEQLSSQVQAASTSTVSTSSSIVQPDHPWLSAERAATTVKNGMASQHYADLQIVFDRYANEDGKLELDGFIDACNALGTEYDDLKDVQKNSALSRAIFSSFSISDTPKDWLTLDEFVVGVYLMTKGTVEEKAHNLFQIIDTSGDGKISREELTIAMEQRIRTVKRIFPKLLSDQVQLQMANDNVHTLNPKQNDAMKKGLQAIESLMADIEKEIPLAVNQIFLEADLDQDDFIREDEWLFAWQAHPEFVELMTIDGMKKVAQWASVVNAEQADAEEQQTLETRLTYVD